MGKPKEELIKEAYKLLQYLIDDEISTDTHHRIEQWFYSRSGNDIKTSAFLEFIENEITPNENPESFEYEKFKELIAALGIMEGSEFNNKGKKKTSTNIKTKSGKKVGLRVVSRIAAVLIPILIVAGIYLYIRPTTPSEMTSEIVISTENSDDSKSFSLPDKSQVELFPGSTLSYDPNFEEERVVTLSGRARFQVAKLENQTDSTNTPFRVHSNKLLVTVHGTDFVVSDYPGDSLNTVSLFHGSLNVNTHHDQTMSKDIVPGERYDYNHNTGERSISMVPPHEMKAFGYKPTLRFIEASLGDMLMAIEAAFDVEIETSPEINTSQGRYSVNLEGETLDKIMTIVVIVNNNDIAYKQTGNKIVITRNK